MKPLSNHWADTTAVKVIKTKGDKPTYKVASGITPSGRVHVGNFREVITVDLVARALRALGKEVTFIYSWDNFDTFRKVPKNIPDVKSFEPYLHQPIARIPDPWGKAESFAAGQIAHFEEEVAKVGIKPAFKYQEELYSKGTYASEIRHSLEQVSKIKDVLNAHRTSPLEDDWLPTSIYCSKCHSDQTSSQKYLGEWDYHYVCGKCQNEETIDIRQSKNLKLIWRVDWPMRWHYEKVDFEPGGKDHSSQGGSFDTAKEIIKTLWQEDEPVYLQYDFVMIKGGTGKMSSSSGELYTLSQLLEVYDPQMVRWIFASQRPNHDFAIAFDEDVIKIYDEFDRAEASLFASKDSDDPKLQNLKRTYELSLPDGVMPLKAPFRAAFRVLCNRLQICNHDTERTLQKFYKDDITNEQDKLRFYQRSECAIQWLKKHAPQEFCYELFKEKVSQQLDATETQLLVLLKNFVSTANLDTLDAKEVSEELWTHVLTPSQMDAKDAFKVIYRQLIGRDQGPRLPMFLKEIGKGKLLELL